MKSATLKRDWSAMLKATTKVADRAQKLLVEFGKHYVAHGDTSLLGWAVETTWSTGFKREAMIKWVSKHLKVSITEAGKGKVTCEVKNKDRATIDMGVAAGDIFYHNVEKKAVEDKEFDLAKAAASIVKRADKVDIGVDAIIQAIRVAAAAAAEKANDKPVFDAAEKRVVALG